MSLLTKGQTVTVDLSQYGIKPEFSADTFKACVALIERYNSAAEKDETTATSKVSEVRKTLVEQTEKNEQAQSLLSEWEQGIRSAVFSTSDFGPIVHAMLDRLQGIVSELKEESTYQIEKTLRANKPEKVANSELATMKDVAESASIFARKVYETLPLLGMTEELALIPTKAGKNGVLPDVPRIKSGSRETDGISPRIKRLRMSICTEGGNFVPFPVGTLMSEVAHEHVSSADFRVNASQLRDMIESQNGKPWHDKSWSAETPWTVNCPNDKSVRGYNSED